MKMMTAALALGTALVLSGPGPFGTAAHARTKVVRAQRIYVAPIVTPPPYYWDSNIVPRYRYRPEDDRVDPYGRPVVPVIRYGNQEVYLSPWTPWY